MVGRRAAVWLLVLMAATACDADGRDRPAPRHTPVETATARDSRVIGLVGTTSGTNGWRGDEAFEGADVAVAVVNRALGGDEPPFELVTRSDGGDPAQAARLVRELARSEQTVGIVYAGPPEGLPRAEQALAAAGIPAVLCYGDLYGARRLTPHVFQASPPFVWQARRLAAYLLSDRRYVSVGALVESSPTGRTAAAALRSALRARGGRRAVVARYDPLAESHGTQLRALRSAGVEAVIIQGSPGAAARIVEELDDMGARYRTTAEARLASAPRRVAARRRRSGWWHPQVAGFDAVVSASVSRPVGAVASESYARGAHYLPVPALRSFREAFRNWWGEPPAARQLRAYDAVRMITWADRRARREEDRAAVLERLRGRAFGGLDVTFGPDDHTAVDEATVGLWTLPRPGAGVSRREVAVLPWVPLARGFSIDGRTLDIPPEHWAHLVVRPPPRSAPAPRHIRLRFGVRTTRRDPIH